MAIIVVGGFPRSGSSMMMNMLRAAGIPWTQQARNVSGEDPRCVSGDWAWLEEADGKAIKVLDPHRFILPTKYDYQFILMLRDLHQQAKSFVKFSSALFPGLISGPDSINRIASSFGKDMPALVRTASSHSHIVVHFENTIERPRETAEQVDSFLHCGHIDEMTAIVEQRSPQCAARILELDRLETTTGQCVAGL